MKVIALILHWVVSMTILKTWGKGKNKPGQKLKQEIQTSKQKPKGKSKNRVKTKKVNTQRKPGKECLKHKAHRGSALQWVSGRE